MGVLDLRKDGSVFILTMIDTKNSNTFTPEVFDEHIEIIDEIEKSRENCCVVLTSGDEKSWSQGINLQWLRAQPPEYEQEFKDKMDIFLTRWALADFPTVACLTGHTFAGGAILASAMDFRLMREDRGWFCFSEVDVKVPLTPLMHEVVELLPNPRALRDLLLTGKRIGGGEAAELGVVDGAYPQGILFEKSVELARMLAEKDRNTYGTIKRNMRRRLISNGNK
jgi:enoyl-CoA hydratase/carnithine racemase